MTPAQSIALPCVAMAVLTFLVAGRMYVVRAREMREKRISPQQIATSTQAATALGSVQASDNYKNLFELPVLFYALCALLVGTGQMSDAFVFGAWLFVALRYVHSLIHCTYNRVMHRFAAFLASALVLAVLWGFFAVVLLRNPG